jgi:hypothetical protein
LGLLDDLSQVDLLDSKYNKRCGMCRLLEELDPLEADKLREVLGNPNVAKSNIARVLQRNGHRITLGVLTRHARGECAG